MFPRITIVTPSYNQGRFLEATIESVIGQNYPNLEYIVLDGGSSDNSPEIIQRYSGRLDYWESRRDAGQADAIQRGFSRSTGEILGWLNSDDILLPGALAAVGDWFRKHQSRGWAVGGTAMITTDGVVRRDRIGCPVIMPPGRVTAARLLHWECGFCQPAVFWRKSLYDRVGGIDPTFRFCMDYDLFVRFAREEASGSLFRILAGFRQHPASKTSTMAEVQLQENERVWRRYERSAVGSKRHRLIFLYYMLVHRVKLRFLQVCLLSGVFRFGKQLRAL